MSVYNADKRIYPPLDDIASAPPDDESQIYRLKKIEEIENFFMRKSNNVRNYIRNSSDTAPQS